MQRFLILFTCLFLFACSGQSKEEMLKEGKQLRENGNLRGSIVLFKSALEKDPNFLEARSALADAYLDTGSFDKAENEFKKVLHQNPAASDILLKLAAIYTQQNKPEAALLELDKFHSTNPETAESLTAYGRAHGASGDLTSAENLFKKALLLEPKATAARLDLAKVYLYRQQIEPARQLLDEVIELDNSVVAAYYLLATIETRSGNRDAALGLYQTIVQNHPKELEAYYMVGLLMMDAGQLDEAQQAVDKLLATFKGSPEGQRLKGMLLYRQGKYEEAGVAFELSLKSQQHVLAYFFLGLTRFGQDQLELALSQFQKALDLAPNFERARVLVAMTLLKQKRIDDAILEIQKVLKTNPDNAYAHNILGSAYLAQGKYDEGMEELETATDLDPTLADAHLKRGIFHLAKGDGAQGEADLVKAVEAAPEVMNSRLMLVTHYLRQKNYSAAIESIQAGLDGTPADALLNNYLAAAYFSQQKPEQALEALQQAKLANPEYLTPYFNLASYYTSQSQHPKAISEYQSILALDAKNIKALLGMAAVYTLQGDNAGLDKVFKQLEATATEEGFVASSTYKAKQKDFAQALSIVDRGLATHKNSATLLGLKGGLHQQQKQNDEAESAYVRLAVIVPERGNSLLANLYVQNGKQDKAKQLVDSLLRSDADKEYPYLLASGLALSKKQPEEAVAALQSGISSVKGHIRLQMQLATVYMATAKEQLAEQTYQRIIEETPRFAPAYTSLGMINERRGDKGKALDLYRTAIKYDQNNIGALNNLAYLLTDNFGQEKEALQHAMKAYRSQPSDPRIMDTVGYVLLKNKNTKDALTLLAKANELLPEVATIKLHLAMAKAASGGGVAAKELLQQVLNEGSEEEIKQANKLLKSL